LVFTASKIRAQCYSPTPTLLCKAKPFSTPIFGVAADKTAFHREREQGWSIGSTVSIKTISKKSIAEDNSSLNAAF
jgi:hypothetical protein